MSRSLGRSLVQAVVFAAALLLVTFILKIAGFEASTHGNARVIDGDSLEVDGREIRLQGIDAPESRQTCLDERGRSWACGQEARRVLVGLTRQVEVACVSARTDRYGRLLGHCKAGKLSLNEEMVRLGLAIAYLDPPLRVVRLEFEAHSAKRGIWRGQFERPKDWRDREKLLRGDLGAPD